MANAKTTQKSTPSQTDDGQNNAATAAQDAAGGAQTAQENTPQGGGNASGQEDTGMDKTKQKKTAGTKGAAGKVSRWHDEARKILKKYPSEDIYFTADGFCFLQLLEAEHHAATLQDKTITTINKKDLE
jgi:hypothetical protein